MQIARYESLQYGADAAGSEHRRRATPVERILEGELLRGERRERRERRHDAPRVAPEPPLASYRIEAPPPVTPLPGNSAIAAYLRAADPGHLTQPVRLHVIA